MFSLKRWRRKTSPWYLQAKDTNRLRITKRVTSKFPPQFDKFKLIINTIWTFIAKNLCQYYVTGVTTKQDHPMLKMQTGNLAIYSGTESLVVKTLKKVCQMPVDASESSQHFESIWSWKSCLNNNCSVRQNILFLWSLRDSILRILVECDYGCIKMHL